jgi:HAD superfamily hydrolase (TIGR01549 family)
MIRTILFDMGGTLDGDGLHWLERFVVLYREHGIDLPRETIRLAFDEAERRAATDEKMATAGLTEMIVQHVEWQMAHLRIVDPRLEQHVVRGFMEPVRAATADNTQMLAALRERGFELGIVSNGCGNVDKLSADFGYAPFLTLIVDSRRVGICKPDPGIFRYAAEKLGRDPGEIMMVGDSFERDIRPAKEIGMKTAWLEGPSPRDCPDPAFVDVRLRRLADLPGLLSSPTLASA